MQDLFKQFNEYHKKNKGERFWQALKNWSGASEIRFMELDPTTKILIGEDTYYWEDKKQEGIEIPTCKTNTLDKCEKVECWCKDAFGKCPIYHNKVKPEGVVECKHHLLMCKCGLAIIKEDLLLQEKAKWKGETMEMCEKELKQFRTFEAQDWKIADIMNTYYRNGINCIIQLLKS